MTPDESSPRPLPARLDPRVGKRADHASGARRGTSGRLAATTRVLGAVLSGCLLAGSGWGWHLASVAEASVNRTDAIPTAGNSDAQGNGHAGQAMNLLLVGMDSRQGLTPEQQAEYATGDPDGLHNTDSMMLVHLPADGSAASFVSFPRDMYVSIPGNGKGKLNSAYGDGYEAADGDEAAKDAAGAQLLIQTISQLSGLEIDHFAEINLLGFINLSAIVGGVEVDICEATDDPVTGAHFDAGVQTLTGSQALLFVRQRHGLSSDLDRVARQQVYIGGMLRNMLSANLLLDPAKQAAIVKQVGSSVTLDQGLDVFDLAGQMQAVQPGNITFQTIPGLTDGRVEGWGSVLQPPSADVLQGFFASLSATPSSTPSATPTQPDAAPVATIAPADVTVSVLNGSGVTGTAGTTAQALTAAGFAAASGGNATRTTVTTISAGTADAARAALVATQVPGASVTVDDSLPTGTVQLVLGTDFTGLGQAVTAPVVTTDPDAYVTTERTAEDTSCIA